MKKLRLVLMTLALGWLCTLPVSAQVAVAPLQVTRQQFFNGTGAVLSAGCVNFFATGTSTPQAIYADSTGTSQLQNPLTLDSTGSASVWMTNAGYDIVMNAGVTGTACSVSVGTQVWKEVNKNPFAIINAGSNYIVASGTSDPAGSAGMLGYRTDIPCFRGFTTIWDCFATLTGVQILTNKTLTAPTITGTIAGSPTITTPTLTNPTITGGGSWAGSPSLTTPTLAAGTPTVAGGVGYGGGNLNVGNGSVNNIVPFQTGAIVPNHLVSWNTGGVVQDAGFAIVPPTNILINATAPTISSGFGTSATIPTNNGPASFTINVGTGGTASAGTINLPTAANGWNCFANDITNPTVGGGISTKQTGSTVNTASFTGFNATPAATAWTASDILQVSCFGR